MSSMLVFPRVKPLGSSGSSRRSVRKDATFPTEVIDYLKLSIYEHQKGRQNSAKYGGKGKETIFLYLPPGLNEKYTAKYEGKSLGKVGAEVMDAAGSALAGGQDIGTHISRAADAAKPALGFKVGAEAINTLVGTVSPFGSGLDANDIAGITRGEVFNPYEEMLFKGVSFINHSFKFTMVPKSAADVEVIYKIINTLRASMHPAKAKDNNWLTIPDKFRCEIVRYSSKGDEEELGEGEAAGGYMNSLLRFPNTMVLQDMSVDFGDSTAIRTQIPGMESKDFGFAVYNMTLSFQEIKYRTREDFE
tara:strand:+ start:273 stop:1184 length:912 start_codon:yes stop_codon:yes gene_type:complete